MCARDTDKYSMSTGAVSSLSSSYLQQILASALQSAGNAVNINAAKTTASPAHQSDSSQLSPFAQLVSTLQQLQQSNPTEYKQVTAQIATNLQTAAQTAQSQGNSGAASQLNQLATDFTSASQSGQLPNLQDLAEAVGGSSGGRHHHHHAHEATSDSSSASSSSTAGSNSSGGTSQALSQLLSSLFQTGDSQSSANTQNPSTNPGAIILQTLANAGIPLTNNGSNT
jgi:hypothetical protein